MKGNHFLKLLDLTPSEIEKLLASAADFKAKKKSTRGGSSSGALHLFVIMRTRLKLRIF